MRNTDYVLIEDKTGFVVSRHSVPSRLFPPDEIPEGRRLVATAGNDRLPPGPWQFDLGKVPDAFNIVSSYMAAVTTWRPKPKSEKALLSIALMDALAALDREYAMHIASLRGPLASLHDEKRRQAEAGGGPLVADEADRIAILANAQKQDEQIALIEKQRRAIKAQLRDATTEDEIKAALAAREGFA